MNSDRNTLFTFFTPQYVTQHRKNEAALNHTPYAKYFTDDLEVPCDMVQALKLAPLPESSLFPPTKAGLNALFQSPYDLPVAGFGLIGNKDTGRIICSWSRHFFPGATSAGGSRGTWGTRIGIHSGLPTLISGTPSRILTGSMIRIGRMKKKCMTPRTRTG